MLVLVYHKYTKHQVLVQHIVDNSSFYTVEKLNISLFLSCRTGYYMRNTPVAIGIWAGVRCCAGAARLDAAFGSLSATKRSKRPGVRFPQAVPR